MSAARSYIPPVEIGEVMRAGGRPRHRLSPPGVCVRRLGPKRGADLVLAGRRAERLEATRPIVEQAGGRAIAAAADVALPESALAVVEAAITEFGHVDVLVNNRSHPPT